MVSLNTQLGFMNVSRKISSAFGDGEVFVKAGADADAVTNAQTLVTVQKQICTFLPDASLHAVEISDGDTTLLNNGAIMQVCCVVCDPAFFLQSFGGWVGVRRGC